MFRGTPGLFGYRPGVGINNFLVEGVSGTGRTSVCGELRRRGFHAINGDTQLAYQGVRSRVKPTEEVLSHSQHIGEWTACVPSSPTQRTPTFLVAARGP